MGGKGFSNTCANQIPSTIKKQQCLPQMFEIYLLSFTKSANSFFFLRYSLLLFLRHRFPPLRHPAGYTHRSGKRRQERARERLHEGKTHHACTYLPTTYCYRRRPTSLLPTQVECVRVQCNPPPLPTPTPLLPSLPTRFSLAVLPMCDSSKVYQSGKGGKREKLPVVQNGEETPVLSSFRPLLMLHFSYNRAWRMCLLKEM